MHMFTTFKDAYRVGMYNRKEWTLQVNGIKMCATAETCCRCKYTYVGDNSDWWIMVHRHNVDDRQTIVWCPMYFLCVCITW